MTAEDPLQQRPVRPAAGPRLELVLQRLAVGDGDDALLAHALHGARDQLADLGLAVCADGAHLRGRAAAPVTDAACTFKARSPLATHSVNKPWPALLLVCYTQPPLAPQPHHAPQGPLQTHACDLPRLTETTARASAVSLAVHHMQLPLAV